jgi:hypothetical protein
MVRIVVIDVANVPAAHLPVVEINAPGTQPRVGSQVAIGTSVMYALSSDAVTVVWRQLQGPEPVVTEDGRNLVFTPAIAGRYLFRATPVANGRIGVEDEIEVSVAGIGLAGPVAAASVHSSDDADGDDYVLFVPGVGVDNLASNARINMSAAGSAVTGLAPPTYRWRQVSGPTVGIAGVTTAEASIAPKIAGVYSFEVEVRDGAGLSGTAKVAFAVDTFDPLNNPTFGNSLPRPTVTQPTAIVLGSETTITGSVFDPNDASPGHRWVQLSGAPLILGSVNSASTVLSPPVAGVYRFALHGTDGKNRGPGGVVTLNVNQPASPPAKPAGGGGGGCVVNAGGGVSLAWLGLLVAVVAGTAGMRRRRWMGF